VNVLVATGTATFTSGSANVGMAGHGRSVNDPIKLFTTGSLPTNFTASTHGLTTVGTIYYVKSIVDANTVTLSATPGGTAFVAGSAGSGTQTWVCAPHGDGDGSTTFTVPDYRGEFLRVLDNGAGIDANRSVGSLQLDAMQGHWHSTSWNSASGGGTTSAPGANSQKNDAGTPAGSPISDGLNGTPRTAPETRPRNVAALVTIRYAA
jgi:phage-related tail fiber protein